MRVWQEAWVFLLFSGIQSPRLLGIKHGTWHSHCQQRSHRFHGKSPLYSRFHYYYENLQSQTLICVLKIAVWQRHKTLQFVNDADRRNHRNGENAECSMVIVTSSKNVTWKPPKVVLRFFTNSRWKSWLTGQTNAFLHLFYVTFFLFSSQTPKI